MMVLLRTCIQHLRIRDNTKDSFYEKIKQVFIPYPMYKIKILLINFSEEMGSDLEFT